MLSQAEANLFRETSKLKRNSSRAETEGTYHTATRGNSGRFKKIKLDKFLPINGEVWETKERQKRQRSKKASRQKAEREKSYEF